jgi:hypothetical protein
LHEWNESREVSDISGCTGQWAAVPLRVVAEGIHVVLVDIAAWDAGVIRFPDGRRLSVLDPDGRAMIATAYEQFTEAVRSVGAVPVFVRPADANPEWDARDDPLDDPARWVALREIIDSLGVAQIDLPQWIADNGLEGPVGRPDGVHLAPDHLARFVADAVVPALLAVPAPPV